MTFTALPFPIGPPWRNHIRKPNHRLARRMPQALLAPETGPLHHLRDRRVLALMDVENLTISARQLGFDLDYKALARRLGSCTRSLNLHAALSVDIGDTADTEHMTRSGFTAHTRNIERLASGVKSANADNLFAFHAGMLVSHARADIVILGSGDGALVCDVAGAIHALPTKRAVLTLSLPGATSARLHCRRNPAIEANLEIGCDVLIPVAAGSQGAAHGA